MGVVLEVEPPRLLAPTQALEQLRPKTEALQEAVRFAPLDSVEQVAEVMTSNAAALFGFRV
ncbi:hypothetical protein [Cystobacter ferrugineus]|uniref:Uncharacterized protein n=1 Tax=Cystobacter ferrugineus TaxID=83449 RepID=A0A1L9BCE0_9BACT|nr:hypothetical protein [Cystobacter ferrugineus]OJH39911.1 hypothetical protein BON30_12555 [Cystobacter ferrugineus]